MVYEVGGYTSTPAGVPQDVWKMAAAAGRRFEETDPETGKVAEYVYTVLRPHRVPKKKGLPAAEAVSP